MLVCLILVLMLGTITLSCKMQIIILYYNNLSITQGDILVRIL